MNDRDKTTRWLSGSGEDLPDRLWTYEGPVGVDDGLAADPATGLISVGFIGTALRRGRRVWCAFAIAGLLIGSGLYVKSPPSYKATVSVLLGEDPNQDPAIEVQTDIALAQSDAVAKGAIRQLGLSQAPSAFRSTYTVTSVSDQVLTITTGAPDSAEAVREAAAVADQFLKFRAQYAQEQEQQTDAQLDQQVSRAEQALASATGTDQRQAESNALTQLRQYATTTKAAAHTTAESMIHGSAIMNDAAPVKRSAFSGPVLYVGGGLILGLVVGLAIVIIGGVTSDRLLRRDDIAYVFGAPVRLSVGRLRRSRWLPSLPRQTAIWHRDMDRVVELLRTAVPGSARGPAGLAVAAVDDVRAVARSVVATAVSCGRDRMRVVLADLSAGACAARLLGADRPGVSTVNSEGVQIVVIVPRAEDVAPVGPLGSHTSPEGYAEADASVVSACAGADIVLSLVTLDPASGSEHLATWATDAVAVVTAGKSSEVRIHAAGEMVRLAGIRLGSVVVLDADEGDESVGAACQPASL